MFELEKTFSFEAGHQLKDHNGQCARPHGHSYRVTIAVRGEKVVVEGSSRGMVVDFQAIGAVVRPMLEKYFDHQWLNETLMTTAPTAEYMAQWIFEYVQPKLQGLYRVTVYETATSSASYWASPTA